MITPQTLKGSPRTLQPLRGFRDFLPQEARERQWLKEKMVKIAEKWGYEPLETPTLESLELFKGEIGEDEKLFFQFEDLGGRKVALRYDQSVPTCRVIGQYFDRLTFPFRRYQFQSAFRAEKPQKGRYREFAQFDIDIFGVAQPEGDAETIAVTLETYLEIGFKKPVIILSNRDLMKGIPYEAIVAIDKINKIGEEGVIKEMNLKNIPVDQANKYLDFVKKLKPDETIKRIFKYLKSFGFSESMYRFEPTLARSFSYSQGPIWEVLVSEYESGSLGGGERYDGMMNRITGLNVPATGIAFGFDRTLEAAKQLGLVPDFKVKSQLLMTIFSSDLLQSSIKMTKLLRDKDILTELYPDQSVKLDKQLKYADKKGIPYVAIIGPDEAENNTVTLKNLATKEQKIVPVQDLPDVLQKA